MLCSSLAFPAYASSDTSAMRKAPAFASGYSSDYDNSETKSFNSKTYYSNGIQLYKTIRNNLEKRNNYFTIHYLSESKLRTAKTVLDIVERLFLLASGDEISQSTTDGDYIRWAISDYGFDSLYIDKSDSDYYYYTINLKFEYYDTAAQEAQVDAVVKSFVSGVDTDSMTDYEIIKRIHDFICSKTTYDSLAAFNYRNRGYAMTAYGALVKGKCICQGYSVAFYRLCKELGYNARFVSSSLNEGRHAWNIVQLDGKYYYVDLTWDDEFGEADSADKYNYFLVDYNTLRSEDSSSKEHTLYDKFYNTDYFRRNYRNLIDENNYNASNKNLLSQSIISLSQKSYVYSGKPVFPEVVSNCPGYPQNYSLKYSDNIYAGKARVDICSADGSVIMSHRIFEIAPNGKKPSAPSKPVISSLSSKSKSVKVKWKKIKCSGYQIQYSADKSMNGAKSVNAKASSVIKTVTSLKKGKRYYIRIRAYKNDNTSGKNTKVYSKWSAKKSIICK